MDSRETTKLASAPKLVELSPAEFIFHRSSKGGYSARIHLKNSVAERVGFKFKTNAPARYSVKPVLGALEGHGAVDILVRTETKVNPADKFLIQTVLLSNQEAESNITPEVWKQLDRRRLIEHFIECKQSPGGQAAEALNDRAVSDPPAHAILGSTPSNISSAGLTNRVKGKKTGSHQSMSSSKQNDTLLDSKSKKAQSTAGNSLIYRLSPFFAFTVVIGLIFLALKYKYGYL